MSVYAWAAGSNYVKIGRVAHWYTDFSCMSWVRPTVTPTTYDTFLESRDSNIVGILVSNAGTYSGCFSSSASQYNRNTGLTPVNNEWQMVGYTFENTGDGHVNYLGASGSLSTDSYTFNPSATSRSVTDFVQYDTAVGSRSWDGQIAVQAVWDVELTQADMEAMYYGKIHPFYIKPQNLTILMDYDEVYKNVTGTTGFRNCIHSTIGATYGEYGTLTHSDESPGLVHPHGIVQVNSSSGGAAGSPPTPPNAQRIRMSRHGTYLRR